MNFPEKCPYCHKDNIQNSKSRIIEKSNKFTDFQQNTTVLELHRCIHCNEPIFVVKEEVGVSQNMVKSKIIYCYPISEYNDLPKSIKNLSPNAYRIYTQTMKAKEECLSDLIGAGLRMALEWLVWDYLINVKEIKQDNIIKLTLANRIEKMNCDFYTEVCTRLIRLFGNDSVHIIKMINFSIDEVVNCFKMICGLIDSELKINEINSKLPVKKTK